MMPFSFIVVIDFAAATSATIITAITTADSYAAA